MSSIPTDQDHRSARPPSTIRFVLSPAVIESPLMRATTRYASPLVTVMALGCDLRRSGLGETYHVGRTWIGLPLSGIFGLSARGDDHLIHPAMGVVFPRDVEYRMSHPTDDGDTSIALGFAADLIEEALPARLERIRVTTLDLRLRYRVGALIAIIDRDPDALAVDEMSVALLGEIAAAIARAPATSRHRSSRRPVDRVRFLLAERPEHRWTLAELARQVGYSPFHLAREFRAHTGTSVHRYLVIVRAAAALRRIETANEPLVHVAAEFGFAHHSHLTHTMRRYLGITPSAIRARSRGGTN